MNLSGKSFRYWMDKENLSPEQTLTIVDELALPLSKLRLRAGGSPGGHNGLTDIQQTLGTDKYPKLRFGIGNKFPKGMQVDYVLGKWFPEEVPVVKQKILCCIEVIENVAVMGLERTMNIVNQMKFE